MSHYYRDHPERIKVITMIGFPSGWHEYLSPNGVSHAVPPTGPCATCGAAHPSVPSAESNRADIRSRYIARFGEVAHQNLEQSVLLALAISER